MGVICVKKGSRQEIQSNKKSSMSSKQLSSTIQTKMDKTEYQRLQIIKEFLATDTSSPSKIKKQDQNQRQIGDFKFLKHLGDGSYGEVVMVKDNKTGQFYAMKIIRKDLIIERQQILNALSQRYILAAMDHPFIVKLHYAFQTKNKIHLIVDLMAGGQLFFLLRKNKKFNEETAKFYAAQILLAIEYLHTKKIIYRDLKPENILLDRQGHIKITDFGLSKVVLKKNQVATSVCGTPEYIAPEVLKGKGYSITADWFSFGSLVYDMLTGRPPFYSKDKDQMMLKVQTQEIPFPQYISESAKSLLKSLFQKKEQNRLGFKTDAEQIKNHEFFKGINFNDMLNRKLKPPFSFEDEINSDGFAVKFDELAVQQSYENEMVQQSKGVNFEGFTYQVKGMRHPDSKAQITAFQLQRRQTDKQGQQEDLEMNMQVHGEYNQLKQVISNKDSHKQKSQNKKDHKRSTFSMSIHELQKKKQDDQKISNQKQLQSIRQYQKSSLRINETLNHEEMNSPNKELYSPHKQLHSTHKRSESFGRQGDIAIRQEKV